MMTYRKNKKNKNKSKVILLGIFLLVLFTPVKIFFGNISSNIFSTAFTVKVMAQEIIENTELSLMSKSQLIQKIKTQEEEIKRLTVVENLYNELITDYEKNIELLGIKNENPQLVLAEVVSSPSQNIYDTILINKSFKEGSFVFSESGVPIGTIEKSNKNNSSVLFFSHSGRETDAFLGADSDPVVLVGKGSGNFIISLPREVKVSEGDSVYIPGVKSPIARVGFIEFDARDPFQTVFLLSDQNVYKIEYVLVQDVQDEI